MAKKTAASKKLAPPSRKKSLTKSAAVAKPAVEDGVIGEAAGAVWGLLHDGGPQTLAAIKKGVDAPSDVALMAVGWLAREGKLEFVASGRSVKVALR